VKSTRVICLCLISLVLSPLGACSVHAQEESNLNTLAAQFAAALDGYASRSPGGNLRVFVATFDESSEQTSQLGPEMTREFEEALRIDAQGFRVLTRDEMQQTVTNKNLAEGTLSSLPAMQCYGPMLDIDILIQGNFNFRPLTLGAVLDVSAKRPGSEEAIFSQEAIIHMTPALKELAAMRAPPLPPLRGSHEDKVWISRDHPPASDDEVVDLHKGAGKDDTEPICLSCPGPNFPDAAVKLRFGGTVVLRVQILADGSVSKISVEEGLPCGLTDKAFEAVEHWKFKPAMTSDGTPVATNTNIDVTFRLF